MGSINPIKLMEPMTPMTPSVSETVGAVLVGLVRQPVDRLVRRWNWKSALLSSASRAGLFFFVNLSAGPDAALAAMFTELTFRATTAGFYGAITQAFSRATPAWAAMLTAMVVLPIATHSLEFAVHWLRGTEKLAESVLASAVFTALSTVFNLFAMSRGALIVGAGRASLGQDMLRMPSLVFAFVATPIQLLLRVVTSRVRRLPSHGADPADPAKLPQKIAV
jgi:hypothetical protein